MVKILGPDGQPIDMALLKGQTAAPEQYGQRALDFTSEASGLTPTRLALIMSQANHGFARAYLTLAIDMEERYLHYASQLQTRRLALDGVTLSVSAPSGVNPKAVDLVQSVTESPLFRDLVQDLQDGLGKGYSVAEPAWDYASGALRPVAYHHRDPRFFRYDAIGMTQLCLADFSGEPGAPLARPYFIVHEPKTRAGAPIRRGLARSAAWAFIIQSFTLQDWAAFCEIYGIPLRLGKFGQGATEQDKRILLNAVRSIANDAAAIIPASMEIEFREVSGARGEQVFGNLIGYLDRKISMIVLGQTMTAEDGGSLAQAKIHNEVRRDILRSDARQTASTLNRDLIEPLVAMNLGPQDVYPILQLEIAASEDLQALGQFLKDTVPLGLKVGQGFVRKKASIPDPDNEDELLGPRTEKQSQAPEATQTARQAAPPQEPTQKPALHAAGCGCCARQHAQLAAAPVASPEQTQVELDAIGSAALSDWRQVEDGLLAGLLAAVNGASSFEDAITRLEAATVDAGPLARRLAIATMQARGLGDQED
jgi:phage gp29-like protein